MTTTDSTIWLWQRGEDGNLERVAVPAELVPSDWVEPLQRRYAVGDRVSYTIEDEHGWQPGTVVQDQGLYVAIDGEAPGRYATAHKSCVHPLSEEPRGPSSPPPAAPMASPHGEPEVRTSYRCINARWNIGEPVAAGTQWQASLTLRHSAERGFHAVLQTVLEQRTAESITENWSYSNPATVFYQLAVPRFSALRQREAYTAALAVLRSYFDAGDAVVTGFYAIPDTKPKESI